MLGKKNRYIFRRNQMYIGDENLHNSYQSMFSFETFSPPTVMFDVDKMLCASWKCVAYQKLKSGSLIAIQC